MSVQRNPTLSTIYEAGTPTVAADIVLVHGLLGHEVDTWKHSNGVCWPRDILPTDLSNVRVLSFGYDSLLSQENIAGQARVLLGHLLNKRAGAAEQARPIVFVGQGVGCLIIKQLIPMCLPHMLTTTAAPGDSIYNATKGVKFLGCVTLNQTLQFHYNNEFGKARESHWLGGPSPIAQEMQDQGFLWEAENKWKETAGGVPKLVLYEAELSTRAQIDSSNLEQGGAGHAGHGLGYIIPGKLVELGKFEGKEAVGYRLVLDFLKSVVGA